MKKIGILTFHNSINFGAALQCTALSETLRTLGYDVTVINYLPKYSVNGWKAFQNPFYQLSKLNGLKTNLKIFLRALKSNLRYFQKKKKKDAFSLYWKRHFKLTEPFCDQKEADVIFDQFDVVICGSDQIWNPDCTGGNIDPVYFLGTNTYAKKVAYAPSLGGKKDDSFFNKVMPYLESFSSLSVREQSSCDQLKQHGIQKIETVLDPTLLLNINDWNRILKKSEVPYTKYILVYTLDYW